MRVTFWRGRPGCRFAHPGWCSEASCDSSGCKSRRHRSPIDVVVISSGGKGDRPVRKPGSKSLRCAGSNPGLIRQGEASKLTGRSKGESVSPEIERPRESDCGRVGSVEPVSPWRRPCRHREIGQCDVELPGDAEDGMSGRNAQRKLGTTRGSPRRSRTAKASRISRCAVKSRCAREGGGWGRLRDDGPGHYNPDPSEGPWGGDYPASTAVHYRVLVSRLRAGTSQRPRDARRADANRPSCSGCRE